MGLCSLRLALYSVFDLMGSAIFKRGVIVRKAERSNQRTVFIDPTPATFVFLDYVVARYVDIAHRLLTKEVRPLHVEEGVFPVRKGVPRHLLREALDTVPGVLVGVRRSPA